MYFVSLTSHKRYNDADDLTVHDKLAKIFCDITCTYTLEELLVE